jgi:hypothetical protein
MPPGTYSITVEAGLKKLRKSNVVLNGNERLALGNLALEIGSVDQSWKCTPTPSNFRPKAVSVPRR